MVVILQSPRIHTIELCGMISTVPPSPRLMALVMATSMV